MLDMLASAAGDGGGGRPKGYGMVGAGLGAGLAVIGAGDRYRPDRWLGRRRVWRASPRIARESRPAA